MLDRGTILEKGSHDELMKSAGVITICIKRKWKETRALNAGKNLRLLQVLFVGKMSAIKVHNKKYYFTFPTINAILKMLLIFVCSVIFPFV